MAGDKASVISALRACILSERGGVQLSSLDRDYRSLVGCNIPYRELGYSSLENFIRNAPDLYVSKGSRGETVVHAHPTENSAHIASLVNKQKSSQKKRVPVPNFSTGYRRQSNSQWRIPPQQPPSERYPPPLLSVTTDHTSRHVSLGSKQNSQGDRSSPHKFELPPRFDKSKDNLEIGPRFQKEETKLPVDDLRWKVNDLKLNRVERSHQGAKPSYGGYDDFPPSMNSNSTNSIISPFTPKNAIAAGRAQLQELGDSRGMENSVPTWSDQRTTYNTTYVVRLQKFSTDHNLPAPVYKSIPRHPKGDRVIYGCQVKVGNEQTFSSYPEESYNASEAKEMAAKKAYLKLIDLEKESQSNKFVTVDKALIHERVTRIVEGYPQGMWSEQVFTLYHQEYDENLPTEWITIVSTCKTLSVETVCQGRVIIRPSTSTLEDAQAVGAGDFVNGSSIPESVTETEPENTQLAERNLPSERHWDVYVTNLVTSNEIYLRLIGEEYSDKYDAVMNDAELFYTYGKRRLCPPDNIEVCGYYVVKLDSGWYRICVEELLDGGKVSCQLIDHGDCEEIDITEIYILENQFRSLEPQAFLCSLTDIENIEDAELCDKIRDMIVAKCLVAEVDERDDEKNEYSLTLYDTSDGEFNLNEAIAKLANSFDRPPELPSEGGIKEVYVTHIDENGGLYVQIQSVRCERLESLVASLEPTVISQNRITSAADLSAEKRYLAKFNSDGNYYRAVITRLPAPNETQIEVKFIDYGNNEVVNVEDISNLEVLCPSLYNIHPQSIYVILHNLQIRKKECNRLKELIPENDPVILKIIQGGTTPQVEVFRRSIEPDGTSLLISINNTIAVDQEQNRTLLRRQSLRRTQEQKKEQPATTSTPPLTSPSPPLPVPSVIQGMSTVHKTLPPPPIPDVNDAFFDVLVTMAASPDNFIVQPIGTLNALGAMTSDMKSYFENDLIQHEEVKHENLVEGGLYAAFNGSEIRRVTLSTIIDDNVSVHSCDCGDFVVVNRDQLRYLPPQFTELPYQAIRAKLHGVRPIHVDWATEDCIRFQEMVVDKCLVSIIKEKGPGVDNSDTVLGLQLVDTNSDEDVFIHTELIKEKRALQSESN